MDPRDHQRAAGPRIPAPLDALAQRGIAGATSLFVQSVDLNGIIQHVDLNALLERVDINQVLQRVDVNALLARVDLDALLARVDVDALIDRLDLAALIARSSTGAASETMQDVLEDAKRLEGSADRRLERLFHHDHHDRPAPEAENPAPEDPGRP